MSARGSTSSVIRQFVALTRQTTLETLRQPLALLVVTACVIGIALMPLLITHTLGEARRMVQDSALALQLVCGLVLGAYAAGASLHREIAKGTAALALTKPVHPALFYLAKYTGVAVMLALFSLTCLLATLPAVRAAARDFHLDWWAELPLLLATPLAYAGAAFRNYRTGRSFSAGAFAALLSALILACLFTLFHGRGGLFGFDPAHNLPWMLAPVSMLVGMAVLTLAAVACALATRVGTTPALTLCSAIFLLGLMSDYLFGRHADQNVFAAACYASIPNLQHFWIVDALHRGHGVPLAYLAQAGLYAALYIAGALMFGWLGFRRKETA